jgi:5-methylcytosine-specific restriction endonuclease McrA
MSDEFKFDLSVKRTRLSDEALLLALKAAAEKFNSNYFPSTQYDGLPGKRPHSATIIERFGSWKQALLRIGISGGRERRYSPEQLVQNLEAVWKELGFAPGKRQVSSRGEGISERPYINHRGSLRAACEALEAFHSKRISRDKLLAGNKTAFRRTTIPLNIRHFVMERDNHRCVKCGAASSDGKHVRLEVDHIHPIHPADANAKSGGNELENLQTLCWECNQGKKNR